MKECSKFVECECKTCLINGKTTMRKCTRPGTYKFCENNKLYRCSYHACEVCKRVYYGNDKA